MNAAVSAPRPASRVDVERTLFRPEVFQYQRSLALGEPVDERALPALWCVLPAALLLAIYWLFVSATYHRRVTGSASSGEGPNLVVLSMAAAGSALDDVKPGDEATLRLAGSAPHRMIVRRSSAVPCAVSRRCIEVEGRIDGRALPAGASVPAELEFGEHGR